LVAGFPASIVRDASSKSTKGSVNLAESPMPLTQYWISSNDLHLFLARSVAMEELGQRLGEFETDIRNNVDFIPHFGERDRQQDQSVQRTKGISPRTSLTPLLWLRRVRDRRRRGRRTGRWGTRGARER
jgi:hypothetical protein